QPLTGGSARGPLARHGRLGEGPRLVAIFPDREYLSRKKERAPSPTSQKGPVRSGSFRRTDLQSVRLPGRIANPSYGPPGACLNGAAVVGPHGRVPGGRGNTPTNKTASHSPGRSGGGRGR